MGKLLLAIWVFLGSLVGAVHQPPAPHTAQLSAFPTIDLSQTALAHSTGSALKFFIRGGSGTDANDAGGYKILKPRQLQGINMIELDSSLNGRTAALPVGTKIFLQLPGGSYKISIQPEKGIVEPDKDTYTEPKDNLWLLNVVGQGSATITATK